MVANKKGMMFVLSSPSGAGKTTLTKKIAENNPQFVISISHTTRKPRPKEIDGKDYHFVTSEKFNSLIKNNISEIFIPIHLNQISAAKLLYHALSINSNISYFTTYFA